MRSEGFGPEQGERLNGSRLVRDVPLAVVDGFFAAFQNHPGSPATASDPVRRYIKNRAREMHKWDVLFAGVNVRPRSHLRVTHPWVSACLSTSRAWGKE